MDFLLVPVRANKDIDPILLCQLAPVMSLELIWWEVRDDNLPIGIGLREMLFQPSRLSLPQIIKPIMAAVWIFRTAS
jgi:hypothetical protein